MGRIQLAPQMKVRRNTLKSIDQLVATIFLFYNEYWRHWQL